MAGVRFVQDCPTCSRCKLQDWPGGPGRGVIGQNLCKMQVRRLARGSGRQSCTSWDHWTELVQDASCKIVRAVCSVRSNPTVWQPLALRDIDLF